VLAIFAKLHSCALLGLSGAIVDIEVDARRTGLPAFDLVGLPDAAVREAKDRVALAIKNSGFRFPEHRVVVNLAPADLRKEGSVFDLALALGLLLSSEQIGFPAVSETLLIGELSLDGQLRPVPGVLSMVICARENGFKQVFVPWENHKEAALVDGIEVAALKNLRAVIAYIQGAKLELPPREVFLDQKKEYANDFKFIQGQAGAKRAMEVAAAGGHNILMIGGPGAGKTLLSRSLPSILPPLSFAEMLQITQIHSVAGLLSAGAGLLQERPFRTPHHSISNAGLIGGGSVPRPGEVSLAHNGVLFLDELPEFRRDVLELLRQPLEDRQVTIARVNATYTFPAGIMLVASMNPCPCGFYGDTAINCTCSDLEIRRYQRKISGPLLDRIDIQIEVPRLSYDELNLLGAAETSTTIRERVSSARERQRKRLPEGFFCNAQMQGRQVRELCLYSTEAALLLRSSFERLKLTARAHDRILKVARTIADLAGAEVIQAEHIAEAVGYRRGFTNT
jgi:magnesium chelatase family protein